MFVLIDQEQLYEFLFLSVAQIGNADFPTYRTELSTHRSLMPCPQAFIAKEKTDQLFASVSNSWLQKHITPNILRTFSETTSRIKKRTNLLTGCRWFL